MRALEGVAVKVRQAGDRDPVALVARGGFTPVSTR